MPSTSRRPRGVWSGKPCTRHSSRSSGRRHTLGSVETVGHGRSIAAGIAAIALAVGAIALLWSASEAHFRACVEEASARYPPIAVSAFSGEQTGPLKVAYDEERARGARQLQPNSLVGGPTSCRGRTASRWQK